MAENNPDPRPSAPPADLPPGPAPEADDTAGAGTRDTEQLTVVEPDTATEIVLDAPAELVPHSPVELVTDVDEVPELITAQVPDPQAVAAADEGRSGSAPADAAPDVMGADPEPGSDTEPGTERPLAADRAVSSRPTRTSDAGPSADPQPDHRRPAPDRPSDTDISPDANEPISTSTTATTTAAAAAATPGTVPEPPPSPDIPSPGPAGPPPSPEVPDVPDIADVPEAPDGPRGPETGAPSEAPPVPQVLHAEPAPPPPAAAPAPGPGAPGGHGPKPSRPGRPGGHGGRPGGPRPSAAPMATLPGLIEPTIEPVDPHLWGRIDEQGVVYVRTAADERVIGNWQAGDNEAGLAHFGRRFDDFATEIAVLGGPSRIRHR